MTAKRLLLILAALALLAASGVAWAGATVTTYTLVQITTGIPDLGTTWTEGGITHVRGQVIDTWCLWDYDGDGVTDEETIVQLIGNSDRDANGAGHAWGTWSEYDYDTGTVLLGGGTWQAMPTCWELQGGPEYTWGWVDVLGWRSGPDGDWGQVKGTLTLYSTPDVPPLVNLGEVTFLVPGGK